MKILVTNRSAHDYQVHKKYEAGIILEGCEIKSLLTNEADLSGSYVLVKNQKAILIGAYIKPYKDSKQNPNRDRVLLLNKHELRQLEGDKIIALDFHVNSGKVKVGIATATRHKKYDKRSKLLEKATRNDAE